MVQSRRDLMVSAELLAQKRVEETQHRALMNSKWSELRNKEILLKESCISFNKVGSVGTYLPKCRLSIGQTKATKAKTERKRLSVLLYEEKTYKYLNPKNFALFDENMVSGIH